MIVYISTYLRDCELGFPRILGPADTAQSTTATRRGAAKYMLCGIKDAINEVIDINIPDFQFSVNVGVTKIQLSMKDIKITDLQVPDVQFDLNDNQLLYISLLNGSMQIQFQWSIQQQSYPYVTEFGSGKMVLKNLEMRAIANSSLDPSCPGHILLSQHSASLDYQSLKITLEGSNSWFFQSILDLVLAVIQDDLMGSLMEVIMKGFIQAINNVFENGRFLREYPYRPNVVKDERYTSGILTDSDGFVSLCMSGYVYNKNILTDEYMNPGRLNKFTFNKFNNDIQITVHEEAFNNAFYVFHKYENVYSSAEFEVIDPPRILFMNTVALFSINVKCNESAVNITLLANMKLDNNNPRSFCLVYFSFEKFEAKTLDSHINIDLIQEQVIAHLHEVIQYTAYELSYTHLTDLNYFKYIYDPFEHVVRFVGPEEFVCPE
ncbi:Conserved_hypothetical protein [Hexamita inflata]|uniref:Lipid-binding serum glycoprotein N-terminal domain-containing protein n=1 Tax=Hexamita inflata TaxID=28002 RepID=A0ABP1HZA2_9EUKA